MAVVGRIDESDLIRIHPEVIIDNFSIKDCDISFFGFVRALQMRTRSKTILDFGAGRNAYVADFDSTIHSYYIKELRDLRYGGAHVTAADIDEVVSGHPTSMAQVILVPDKDLPFPDEQFDLIVSDYAFEHIENPEHIASELTRILKPGGWIVARTPNKFGYLAVAASLVPNRLHSSALGKVQPARKAKDTFPTHYRLNTLRDMQKRFQGCEVFVVTDSWEPAYFFGKSWLYHLFRVIHWLTPKRFGTAHVFMVRKRFDKTVNS